MPPAGILVVGAFAVASYLYIGVPIAHGAKKLAKGTKHAIVHVIKKLK